ncbi:SGNH/GDSL hydrolase family protein [Sphingomicrobium clamense]|uniref:SGNH/GDSL hydrolase family protein n=1 Tax=Sphingomicrobium clamense TaxID=2851013 RepID=A0ABS6V5P8_9SPHN|nr:SGNH/GDSL hydrolase family protein [Sphingomicrobium sp. B8]MBW0144891.1 SGNH/GDSL hydrolase family protein [Sphingomicrobium sp. B8]
MSPPLQRPNITHPVLDRECGPIKVLLIGDSIVTAYAETVAERLADIATVYRPRTNCRHTIYGRKWLLRWLNDTHWDLIHFNFGLHDLAYRNPELDTETQLDKINGKQIVPVAGYAENLEVLIRRLGEATDRLTWATTTIVPENEPGRFVSDCAAYHEAALEVVNRHGLPVNDLRSLSQQFDEDMFVAPGDVHYTEEGYRRLGEQVATFIRGKLT